MPEGRSCTAEAVLDASALVDLLPDNDLGRAVRHRIAGQARHAPAHSGCRGPQWMQRSTLDAEVPSALGRLHRAGDLDTGTIEPNFTTSRRHRPSGTPSTTSARHMGAA